MSIYGTHARIDTYKYYNSGESLVDKEPNGDLFICNPAGEFGEVIRLSIHTDHEDATVLLDRQGIMKLAEAMKWQKKKRGVSLFIYWKRVFNMKNPLGHYQKIMREMKRDNDRHAKDHGFNDSDSEEYLQWLMETHVKNYDADSYFEHTHEWQEKGKRK